MYEDASIYHLLKVGFFLKLPVELHSMNLNRVGGLCQIFGYIHLTASLKSRTLNSSGDFKNYLISLKPLT